MPSIASCSLRYLEPEVKMVFFFSFKKAFPVELHRDVYGLSQILQVKIRWPFLLRQKKWISKAFSNLFVWRIWQLFLGSISSNSFAELLAPTATLSKASQTQINFVVLWPLIIWHSQGVYFLFIAVKMFENSTIYFPFRTILSSHRSQVLALKW